MKKSKKVVEQLLSGGPSEIEEGYFKPLEVVVGSNFEKSFRLFKSAVQAERVIADYRMRQSFESPSEKRRRKEKESVRRLASEKLKAEAILDGSYEKMKLKKLAKKEQRIKARVDNDGNE